MICRAITLTIVATGVGLAIGMMVAEAMLRHLESSDRAARDAEESEPEVEYAVTFVGDDGVFAYN